MKKLFATVAVTVLVPFASNAADGTLTFNSNAGTGNPPFAFEVDGTTKLDTRFVGQIYAGASNNENSLVAVGSAVQFGLFNGTPNAAVNGLIFSNTEVTVPGVTPGSSGFYQIRAWEGTTSSTFAGATTFWGKSGVVGVTFGGDTGSGVLPGPSVDTWSSFSLVPVPEPTSVTLGLLGLGGLIAARRRSRKIA